MTLANQWRWDYVFRLLRICWWRTISVRQLHSMGIQMEGKPTLYGAPIVSKAPNSVIRLGSSVVLTSKSEFTALGVARPCILRTLAENAKILIGDRSGLSGTVICSARSVTIGSECLIGADVIITDTDFHPIAPEGRRFNNRNDDIASEPVVIEDNVFIGAGTIILKGVTIGRNSVIGAGSVVSVSIGPDVVAAGNPARLIRPVRSPTGSASPVARSTGDSMTRRAGNMELAKD